MGGYYEYDYLCDNAEQDLTIAKAKLQEEIVVHKTNEATFRHYLKKMDRMARVGGLAYEQSFYEATIAGGVCEKSLCDVEQAKARVAKAERWLRFLNAW